ATHHVAHGVDLDVVATAVAHPVADALGTRAVCVGEVGDGELALFGKAGVGVFGELFGPVPHVVAQFGLGGKLVGEADLGDAVDVAQRLGQLKVGVVVQPPGKGVDDFLLGQARTPRPAHGQDE